MRLFPGMRVNLGLRGVSLSVGGKGLTTNLSSRGIRTTLGLPGTGLSYTTSTSSGRRRGVSKPSRRQLEAAERRRAIEERRDSALADVEAEEAELRERLDSWRDAPELPDDTVYAAATRLAPFTFQEPPPTAPDAAKAFAAAQEGAAACADAEHRYPRGTVTLAALAGVCAVAAGTFAAACGGFGVALDLLLWAALVIPSVVVPAAMAARAVGARRARVDIETARLVEAEWPASWQSVQAAHLRDVHAWEERRDAAREAHEVEEAERADWAKRLLAGDLVALEESVAESLADLDFPFEALCRVEVPEPHAAYVLLDLPEEEDLLPETRTRVLRDGTKKEMKRAKGERMQGYANLVCGLAFLVARVAFVGGPTLREVTIAAYTQRRQRGSGTIGDDFVYEVTISRAITAMLDHDDLDPVAALERLPSRIKRAASGELGKLPAPSWLDA